MNLLNFQFWKQVCTSTILYFSSSHLFHVVWCRPIVSDCHHPCCIITRGDAWVVNRTIKSYLAPIIFASVFIHPGLFFIQKYTFMLSYTMENRINSFYSLVLAFVLHYSSSMMHIFILLHVFFLNILVVLISCLNFVYDFICRRNKCDILGIMCTRVY